MRLKNIARSFFLLLAISNMGCSPTWPDICAMPETSAGGMGGSGGMAAAPCEYPDATDFAEITAPGAEAFGEAAIAVAQSEVAVAYTQWGGSRHLSVFLQRFTPEGAAIGSPILLGAYDIPGQLAGRDFYGKPTIAAGASRFVTCWGAAFRVVCASVAVGSGDVSTSTIMAVDSAFAHSPHVTFGASGFHVFYHSGEEFALPLGDDASPIGAPMSVPAILAAATDSGYAVVSSQTREFFRLDPNLKKVGFPIQIAVSADSIAALGDSVSVVGSSAETRIDPFNKTTMPVLVGGCRHHRMAVAPRNGSAGVVWTSADGVLRFRAVSATSEAGPTAKVGCTPHAILPGIAPTPDGFLVAAPRPEGLKIRVTRVAQP